MANDIRKWLVWLSRLIETNLIFKRYKSLGYTPLCWGQDYQEITLITKDGLPVKSWYVPYPQAERIIFVLHGRGYAVDHLYGTERKAQILYDIQRSLSADLFYLEYRGYDRNKGKPSFKRIIEDAKVALKFIEKNKSFEPRQIILLGHSLGGGLAVNLATQYPFEVLVLISPMVNLARIIYLHLPSILKPLYYQLRRFSWPESYFYDPLQDASKIICPTFIVHGSEDPVIPPSLVLSFFNIVSQNNPHLCRMILMPNKEHLHIYDLKEALDVLKTMIKY